MQIVQRTGLIKYEIHQLGKKNNAKIYHINLLKEWNDLERLLVTLFPPEPELGLQAPVAPGPGEVPIGPSMSGEQEQQLLDELLDLHNGFLYDV